MKHRNNCTKSTYKYYLMLYWCNRRRLEIPEIFLSKNFTKPLSHTSSHRIVTIHAHALLQTTQAAIISQTRMLTSPDTMYPHNGSSTAATSCWCSVMSFLVLLWCILIHNRSNAQTSKCLRGKAQFLATKLQRQCWLTVI